MFIQVYTHTYPPTLEIQFDFPSMKSKILYTQHVFTPVFTRLVPNKQKIPFYNILQYQKPFSIETGIVCHRLQFW